MDTGSFCIERLPAQRIRHALRAPGALSLPCLQESFRLALLAQARRLEYFPGRRRFGRGNAVVHQDLEMCRAVPDGGVWEVLRGFESLLREAFPPGPDYPFESPLQLNEVAAQRYRNGALGITPHRDRTAYRNVVCLFNLCGAARFYVCEDRTGRHPVDIDAAAGTVILMRAPGFLDPGLSDPGLSDPGLPDPGLPDPGLPDPGLPDPGLPDPGLPDIDERPFHAVEAIRGTRYVVGLRQERAPPCA